VEAGLRRASGKLQEIHATARKTTDEIGDLGSRALWNAAAGLVILWSQDKAGNSAQQVVLDAVNETVQDKAKALHELLGSLSRELYENLRSTADTLRLADTPFAEEFSGMLPEMPVLDLGQITLSFGRAATALLLCRTFAEWRIANRLAGSIGPQVVRALSAYRQLAYEWSEKTFSQVQRRFDAYANGYRAQVERMLGSQELSGEQEQAIRRSLDVLHEKQAKEPVHAAS
jgi:hypothetical protein